MRAPVADWSTLLTSPAVDRNRDVVWEACRFEELTVHRLQAINAARQQVFVIEQCCPYLDADGRDAEAHHLSGWSGGPVPVAYARILAPGVAYAEASIGRVLTTMPARGTGLGRVLVRRAIGLAVGLYPTSGIRISAQSRLQRFYADEAFVAVGDEYPEDGIPHIEMLRASDA